MASVNRQFYLIALGVHGQGLMSASLTQISLINVLSQYETLERLRFHTALMFSDQLE